MRRRKMKTLQLDISKSNIKDLLTPFLHQLNYLQDNEEIAELSICPNTKAITRDILPFLFKVKTNDT